MLHSRRGALAPWILVLAFALPAPAVAQTGVLRVGLASLPADLDPASALHGSVPLIARQAFDTLVQYVEGGSDVEPALATQWAVSKDGLVWTFRLRAGVTFHDGTPLTAQHVVDSLEREIYPGHPLAPAEHGPVVHLLRGTPGVVRQVRARDPRTVEISLLQPYAPLLTVLAHPVFSIGLPVAPGGAGGRWQGTGPFGIVESVRDRVVLDARPGHWGRGPRLRRIVFVEAGGDAQAEAALNAQSLDVVFPAGAPWRSAGAISAPGWRVGYLALGTEKSPFRRLRARQGVAAALDTARIAAAAGLAATPLQGFLPPGTWGRREGPPLLTAEPERARRLFAEAGIGAGAAATLVLADTDRGPDHAKLAEAIQAALAPAGLAVTIQKEPPEAALALAQAGDAQMTIAEAWMEAGDPHFLLYPLSASEGAVKGPAAVNFSFYRNGRLDDMLIRASQLSFRPERERLYVRAQAMLAEEVPWLPLYARRHWAIARPEVRDLRLHPSGNPRLDRVWLDMPSAPPPPAPRPAN